MNAEAIKCQVSKVVRFKIVPCIKRNKHILNISLGMCPTVHPPLMMDTANYLQNVVNEL